MKTLTNTQIRTAAELAEKGWSLAKIAEKLDIPVPLARRYLNSFDLDIDPREAIDAKVQLIKLFTTVVPIQYHPKDMDVTEMSYRALRELWENVKEKAK